MARFTAGLQAFYDELRRRHVFRVAAAYAVGVFVVLQGADLLIQGLPGTPEWVYPTLTVLSLIGFPIVLVLGWMFEWTSKGIRLEASATPAPVEAQPAVAAERTGRSASQPVRAFAYVGLGIVVAIVGMGLSLPLMNSERGDGTLQGQREGVVQTSNASSTTMAVLPFSSLTGGDDAGFADGLAEDITAALAQLGGVEVVSRTSSEVYRDSDKTARTIGAELGVGLILEGTIRRAGNRVRVTAQLIDARSDRHLWASSYDRELTGDVFQTQSQLAQEIVAAIQSVVTPEQADEAENRLLALGYSEQGDQLLNRVEPAYDEAAQDLFAQALEVDSGNPVAHAGMAQTLVTRAHDGVPGLLDSAQHHAQLAVQLSPELPDAHAAQAFVFMMRGEMDSAQVSLRHAVELDESGEAFDVEWSERIRLISPEALEQARRTLVGVTRGGERFEFETLPAAKAPEAASGSGRRATP